MSVCMYVAVPICRWLPLHSYSCTPVRAQRRSHHSLPGVPNTWTGTWLLLHGGRVCRMCGEHLTDEYCRWWFGMWPLLNVVDGVVVVRRGGVIIVVG